LAALDFVAKHGEQRISGLVLVGHANALGTERAQAHFGPAVAEHAGDAMSDDPEARERGTVALVRALSNKTMPADEFERVVAYNRIVPTVAKAGMLSRTVDHADTLRTLTVPTLIIHGTDDRIARVDTARYAAALVPHADLRLYDGVAHAPAWEERERFNADLETFASRLAGVQSRRR
jgi:pimeloyl-ACP methyl ester carboxylesterase